MKACIIAPYRVFPATDGVSNRVKEISSALNKKGVHVVLLHAGESGLKIGNLHVLGYPALENYPLTRGFIWSRGFDAYLSPWNPSLYQFVLRVVKRVKADILQIEGPWGVLAAELARVINQGMYIVYDAHNIELMAARFSAGVPWVWPYVSFLERRAVNMSDAVLCVSELDKVRMCSLYSVPSSKITVAPNGVHAHRYRSDSRGEVRRRLGLGEEAKIVFFHGLLRWRPNLEAATSIVEYIAPRFEVDGKQAVFLIAGAHPPRRLVEKSRRRANVRVLGYVQDIEYYICASDICVAPMRTGAGTKLKILEYFAAGKPVVATRKAVEGMGVRDGVEAFVFDDVGEEFLGALRQALSGQVPRGLRENARVFAEGFEWSFVAEKILDVYNSLMSR